MSKHPRCKRWEIECGARDFRVSMILKVAAVFGDCPSQWVLDDEGLSAYSAYFGPDNVQRKGAGVIKNLEQRRAN
jgi:hypothetical protein